jgi:transcriptional regulator with XRE-family HTH domain
MGAIAATIPPAMKGFRDALLWHMQQHQTTIAALAKGSGVSADVIKKVRSREGASAKAEDAWRIASFFGKDLEQFIRRDDPRDDQGFRALLTLMTQQEKKILEAQMRAMIQARED